MKENNELRKANAELTIQVNSLKWKSFRNSNQRNHVVIGSSIIRDVDQEKLLDTDVKCKRGGCISDVKSVVEQLTPGYESVTLLVGGNDCEAKPIKSADAILKSYSELIDVAKEKCQTVKVSSICPRLNSKDVQDRIDAVNAGLVTACNERTDVKFMNLSPLFHLADGTINDGYILKDGIHITRNAMNKIATKLELHIKDQKAGVCDQKKIQNQNNVQKITRNPQPAGHRTHVSSPSTSSPSDRESWCYNCGEPNHVKDRCHHSQPLKCHLCHRQGHKSKFCDYYSK